MVRYPWYAASLAGGAPGWLTWARYSAFLVLYPIGVVSEMWLLYRGLPAVRALRLHSMALPNWWNFAFDYSYFLVVSAPTSWWCASVPHPQSQCFDAAADALSGKAHG